VNPASATVSPVVSLGGFVPVTLLVLTLLVARKAVRDLLGGRPDLGP
jgi:hypothetical protein